MRYEVVLDWDSAREAGSEPLHVEVKELPSGELEVWVGDRRVEIDSIALAQGQSLRVDGKIVDLVTEGEAPDLGLFASGQRGYARVLSDRLRAALSAKSQGAGKADRLIKSPMPGRVVKVLVTEGDSVKAGQGLIIVEAMKMENELKAKTDGVVAKVHVAAQATVEGGASLITLE